MPRPWKWDILCAHTIKKEMGNPRSSSVQRNRNDRYMQSHYREVPRWGVSSGARHNWKSFLSYIEFKCFLKILYIFDTSKCATNYRDNFELYDGFIHCKYL